MNRVCLSAQLSLLDESHREVVVRSNVLFNLIAEVASNEDNLVNWHGLQLVQDMTQDRLASDMDERLWLREGMGSQPRPEPGHWNDDLHGTCLAFQSPLCSNA